MSPPPPPPFPQNPHNPYSPHALEANGQYEMKPQPPILIVSLNVVNTVTQLLIGAVLFCAISFANLFSSIIYVQSFSQHIYLCVIGYLLLMSQAILTINPHAGWAYSLKYPEKKMIHGVMQILGSILAIVGCIIKIVDSDEHFNTAHSITGIIALILTILSFLGGIVRIIFLDRIKVQIPALLYQIVHMCLGCLTISVAMISLCIAFNDTYKYVYGSQNAYLAISCAVFALIGILITAVTRTFQRLLN